MKIFFLKLSNYKPKPRRLQYCTVLVIVTMLLPMICETVHATESKTQKNAGNSLNLPQKERPAAIACKELEADLEPGLVPQVIGGTPVGPGEFPFMAAIAYCFLGRIVEGPEMYRCAGSLIAKRFVLTAAHCITCEDSRPNAVLFGLVDMNSAEERQVAEQIPIKTIYLHDAYWSGSVYHDIAVLELERDVTYSQYIYPTCLYTDLNDMPSESTLYVTGWGKISTFKREKSNILLKAKLKGVTLEQCNSSYVEMGLSRRINKGILDSQICALDPGYTGDACDGDSGGPLLLGIDETLKKYRIVGIVSQGFSCGGSIPGLYTRVASYLEFIEDIVWPHLV